MEAWFILRPLSLIQFVSSVVRVVGSMLINFPFFNDALHRFGELGGGGRSQVVSGTLHTLPQFGA